MEKKTQTIPWSKIDAYVTGDRNQPWLAARLGVTKAAVTNWKSRGGIPLEHAPTLSGLFNIPLEELMGVSGVDNSLKRGPNRPLSDAAREAILCVVRLDSFDEESRDLLKHHASLMGFAYEAFAVQHSPHGYDAEEVERLLGARLIETGGLHENRGRSKSSKAG
jgi:hypothetical protein